MASASVMTAVVRYTVSLILGDFIMRRLPSQKCQMRNCLHLRAPKASFITNMRQFFLVVLWGLHCSHCAPIRPLLRLKKKRPGSSSMSPCAHLMMHA
ncbi:hypothetical protein F5Y15DRAFT_382297 [Xylariaceae sp. FL0016]|nr:hypothetical protein F5Y15DRAFT_382297 [Xylariaceae sp. FL0016]